MIEIKQKYRNPSLISLLFIFWFFGAIMNCFSYNSFDPIFIFFFIFVFGFILLKILSFNSDIKLYEEKGFLSFFFISWFISGISSIYLNTFFDASQLNDAGDFFIFSTSHEYSEISLKKLHGITNGSLAVVIWRFIYNLFYFIGFEKTVLIGLLINNLIMSFSLLLTLKMGAMIVSSNHERLDRITILYCSCGIFFLFSNILLRDSFSILYVILQLYFASRLIMKLSFYNVIIFCIFTVIANYFVVYIRYELQYFPLLFIFIIPILKYYQKISSKKIIFLIFTTALLTILLLNYYVINIYDYSIIKMFNIRGSYLYESSTLGNNSLGKIIIENIHPFLLPLFFLFTLIFYPLPFWVEFSKLEIYGLLKGLQWFYMIFFLPMILLSLIKIISLLKLKNRLLVLHTIFFIGITLSVIITSGEQRHFALGIPSAILFTLILDFKDKVDNNNYFITLFLLISFIIMLYILFFLIKLII